MLTKLDKIQDQLNELQSKLTVDPKIANKQPNKSLASLTDSISADNMETIKRINAIRSLVPCHQSCDSKNTSSIDPTDSIFTYPYDLDQNLIIMNIFQGHSSI